MIFGNDIARAWAEYGRSQAMYPSLWDGSLQLATLGPQPVHPQKAIDFSGRTPGGTLTNGPVWTRGAHRGQGFQGLRFDGSDDHVLISRTRLPNLTGRQSISVWCNFAVLPTNTASTWKLLVSKSTGFDTAANVQYELGIIGSGGLTRIYYIAASTGAATADANVAAALVINRWYHITATWSGLAGAGETKIYLDGTLIGTGSPAFSEPGQTKAYDTSIGRGSVVLGGTLWFPLNGQQASLGMYSRNLTPSEIRTLARHPNAAYLVRPLPRVFAFTGASGPRWPLIGSRIVRRKQSSFIAGAS